MASPPWAISARFLLLLIIMTVFLAGCGAHQAKNQVSSSASVTQSPPLDDTFSLEDEFTTAEKATVFDPLSGYNRLMTHFNDKVYLWVLTPTAKGYSAVVPEGSRLAVKHFFRNLMTPVYVVNNLLQLKPKRAGMELARFTLNSTFGFFGFFDTAAYNFDWQPHPEDFGQTLGHYGVGSGFHLVLPLLGPSNLRDTVGLVPDSFLDPVGYVDGFEERIAIRAYKQINHTSLHVGEYESFKEDAVDFYTFLRDGYEQRRKKQIKE